MDTTSLVVVGELANGIRAVYKGQVREDGKCDTTYLVVVGEGAVRTQRQRAGVVIVVVGVSGCVLLSAWKRNVGRQRQPLSRSAPAAWS